MTRFVPAGALAAALFVAAPPAAAAANKEQQMLMAELRMMQQQQQVLQQMVAGLADSLKAVSGKIDEQAATSRKALADQRLLIEGMTDTVRILRERADDTNVRLSSITQELESIRQAIASQPAASPLSPTDPTLDPAAAAAPGAGAPAPPVANAPPTNVSPQRTYDSAFSDYTAGRVDLAIEGFQTFLRLFPRHPNADDAQLNIGNALYNAGRYTEAVTEYQRVVTDYAKTESAPAAYYKMGLSYIGLKQPDLARKALETVVRDYPTAVAEVALAKQALDRVGRD